jgi:hemerythrin-like domain-containing protein
MSHDAFETERFRVERVLEILEHAARRLDDGEDVPLSLLKDAVAFVRASEEAAYEAGELDDSRPPLTACLQEHAAAWPLLKAMEESLPALAHDDAIATSRFVHAADEYVAQRREHLRVDDRLFATAATARRHVDESAQPIESVESPGTRALYDRLVEASAIADIGVPTGFPTAGRRPAGERKRR